MCNIMLSAAVGKGGGGVWEDVEEYLHSCASLADAIWQIPLSLSRRRLNSFHFACSLPYRLILLMM